MLSNELDTSILDPVLHDLLDPNVKCTATTLQINGKQIPGYVYEHPVDQQCTSHLLEVLLAVARFGGQGFMKTARSTAIQRSLSTDLKQRADHRKVLLRCAMKSANLDLVLRGRPDANYTDCLIEILLR